MESSGWVRLNCTALVPASRDTAGISGRGGWGGVPLHWLDPLLVCGSPQTLQGPLAQTQEAKETLPSQPAQGRPSSRES